VVYSIMPIQTATTDVPGRLGRYASVHYPFRSLTWCLTHAKRALFVGIAQSPKLSVVDGEDNPITVDEVDKFAEHILVFAREKTVGNGKSDRLATRAGVDVSYRAELRARGTYDRHSRLYVGQDRAGIVRVYDADARNDAWPGRVRQLTGPTR
jgi:hypothetical protein